MLEFSFETIDELNSENTRKCLVTVFVNKKQYESGKKVIVITYKYKYIDGVNILECDDDTPVLSPHPFHDFNPESRWGDIVIENSLTNELINYLVMDDVELTKFSGFSTPQRYRISIMKSLSNFWD